MILRLSSNSATYIEEYLATYVAHCDPVIGIAISISVPEAGWVVTSVVFIKKNGLVYGVTKLQASYLPLP
jgi:hypothetical protein